jgi:uncharacterized protein YoxC
MFIKILFFVLFSTNLIKSRKKYSEDLIEYIYVLEGIRKDIKWLLKRNNRTLVKENYLNSLSYELNEIKDKVENKLNTSKILLNAFENHGNEDTERYRNELIDILNVIKILNSFIVLIKYDLK